MQEKTGGIYRLKRQEYIPINCRLKPYWIVTQLKNIFGHKTIGNLNIYCVFDTKQCYCFFQIMVMFGYIKNGGLLEIPSEILMGEIIWYMGWLYRLNKIGHEFVIAETVLET